MAADLSKVTNNVVVTVKGSFDGGTTWVNLGVYTDVANGSGALSVKKEVFYAPVMKVEVAFDATGALASGHGVALDLALVEDAEQTVKAPVADVVTCSCNYCRSYYYQWYSFFCKRRTSFYEEALHCFHS